MLQKTIHPDPSIEQIRPVHEALLERYGSRAPHPRDPLDGLVLIILSQATNDHNCDRAFSSLKHAFPTWQEALDAPVTAIADAIRSGGLANQKAVRIQQILREIREMQGNLDLNWMHEAPTEQCRSFMKKFHGVGPKTIACVLVFFLNKPAFPVDTHVHRVTKRLGWLRPQAGAEEAHRVLEAAIPDAWKLNLHVNLIAHGRQLCRAQGNGGPRCHECPVHPYCVYGREIGPVEDDEKSERRPHSKTKRVVLNPEGRDPDFFVTVKARP